MTNLLAIDTATENCSVALQVGSKIYSRATESPREHSQRLLGFVDEVIAEAGIKLHDIQGIVVGNGPGSFTGVRIGVSVAQGLAFSLQCPVVGVNSLAALAHQAIRKLSVERVVAAIDARMGEIYLAAYEQVDGQLHTTLEPMVGKPESQWLAQQLGEYTPAVSVGTGVVTYREAFASCTDTAHAEEVLLPLAEDMLAIASSKFFENAVAAADLEPLYVRNEVTWQKLPGR
ncbi:tRNA threonylcarbamoyladenosine biosynthesis protein TsaB [Pseudidiomarina planktonica]|uniref:tRNA threonylcarbamoyladenosine biosynthesis protein TsaB n=1 Tax=Pseudidiomarina planktonica TaxID=1323738 RepID=A0A1Y6F1N1_9GAMM|nr:tRNA (adenosine(37)-N6)-threonylcarbamoyltransferase complex dimerization subunit type 1 TsaB [Pseudidiomarina planktonica]RUO64971.1 tRNA (adenosine(37)-N6)-threonylcarbamoyltransferase complex dimerization subunit type 1 TsaB [Pseudidiomarina planktonica]SMQ68727.1 tRNA threonylcarbamoyladenosine biosynthesis protein TsaB [Pseudidiomarina planktonica]